MSKDDSVDGKTQQGGIGGKEDMTTQDKVSADVAVVEEAQRGAIRHGEFELTWRSDGNVVVRWRLARETRVCSDRSWIARIVGLDKRYGLAREFVTAPRADGYRGCVTGPGIYEYRAVCAWDGQSNYSYVKYGGSKGFFRLGPDGVISDMTLSEVQLTMESLP